MNNYIIALLKCKGVSNVKVARYIINNNFDSYKIRNNLRTIIEYDDYLKFNEYLASANIEIELNRNHNINLITMLDDNFPKKLYDSNDPVVYLYYKGNISLIKNKSVAIIANKDAKNDSLEKTTKISSIVSSNGITVIGGLDQGVDTFSHVASFIGSGSTIAILPSDLEHIVPSVNKQLAIDILNNNGCLISEYPLGYIINKYCYERRDRIKSLLSDALLVVESKDSSNVMDVIKMSKKDNKIVYQLSSNLNKSIRNTINIDRHTDINNFIKKIKEEKREITEQLTLF